MSNKQPITSWNHLTETYEGLPRDAKQWAFRGQQGVRPLTTTLERAMSEFRIAPDMAPGVEMGLVRRFARHYHLYGRHIPEAENYLEWFSLMRHHYAPTRLLDFTYSFYVATYFALESPPDLDSGKDEYEATIWAFDTEAMKPRMDAFLKKHGSDAYPVWMADKGIVKCKTFNGLFVRLGKSPIAMVGAVNPFRRNERITIQQGIFLCPGDVSQSFQDNLKAFLPNEDENVQRKFEIKVTLDERGRILQKLNEMNMNAATLFPGLDGFAKSLRPLLAAPDTLLHAPDIPKPLSPCEW